ncbi:hypothetical protein EGI22_22840 [Lacihabitans sp. LS3-19]|uniref:ELWxxDGT repeat protein n=1 Tax=Lacihabitans sp. LS3-19 TaxID=2487335 RepID=UPI0020CD67C9|nr:ELWxxDGT repeat protein [Lacihabitans sp. LS3-19]MCP9770751.1 hypothetical protein [Lacihabitans sp. LS3-19]
MIPKTFFIPILFLFTNVVGQSLLKDIKTDNGSSHPREFIPLANGNSFFLTKTNTNENTELWLTDGTNAGTNLVKSPYTAPFGPYFQNNIPSNFIAFNNIMLFSAYDAQFSSNQELWISNGTAAGTMILKDIYPGPYGSYPKNFFVLGTKVLFVATNDTAGEELWITDGTSAGTQMVKNIYPGQTSSSIQGFTIFNGEAYFYASNDTQGRELWKTNGTEAGTVVLTEGINSGTASTIEFGQELPVANSNYLFFPINSIVYGREIAYSDGSFAFPVDLNGGYGDGNSNPKDLTFCNNIVYFTATRFGNPRNIVYIDEFGLGNGISGATESDPKDLRALNNVLIYTAVDFNNKRQIYRFENTGFFSQRQLLKNINPTLVSGEGIFPTNLNQRKFIVANSQMYFIANDGTSGFELWKTDGTLLGTSIVKDHFAGIESSTFSNFQLFDNELYYICNDTVNGFRGRKTDGTLAGTIDIEDINPSLGLSNIYPIAKVGNKFYFTGFNSSTGYELYKMESGVASLVKDIKTAGFENGKNFNYVKETTNAILFNYDDGKHGMELWKTDGTTSGTTLFADLNPYPIDIKGDFSNLSTFDFYSGSSFINTDFVEFGGKTYFYANRHLMVTDGVTTPTIFHENAAYSVGSKYGLKEYAGFLYFSVNEELWVTNGTIEFKLKSIEPYGSGSPLTDFNVCNGKLFFVAFTQANGEEVWVTDGTGTGTQLLKELIPGVNAPTYSFKFEIVGNTLFFTYQDPIIGSELWKTDGTNAGTVLVKDISPSSGSNPQYMTNYNNQFLVFSADDGTHGNELWKSDGTPTGTVMVKDIRPGSESSNPINLNKNSFSHNDFGVLFFSYNGTSNVLTKSDLTEIGTIQNSSIVGAEISGNEFTSIFSTTLDNSIGYEPYFYDGNETFLGKDVNPGNFSSGANKFFYANLRNLVMFVADDGLAGKEIHVLKDCRLSQTFSETWAGQNTVNVRNNITSSAKVQVIGSLIYSAGKSILFSPGFETISMPSFTAKIDGCDYNTSGPPPGF